MDPSGDVGGGVSGRLRLRSSSSASISFINTSNDAIDKFGGDGLVTGLVRMALGTVCACVGEGGVDPFPPAEMVDAFDLSEGAPPGP